MSSFDRNPELDGPYNAAEVMYSRLNAVSGGVEALRQCLQVARMLTSEQVTQPGVATPDRTDEVAQARVRREAHEAEIQRAAQEAAQQTELVLAAREVYNLYPYDSESA